MAEAAVLAVAQLRVVGWAFRKKDAPGLQPAPVGARLTLERDAANVHDKNAVRVLHNGVSIGFLERLAAAEAAPCLFDSRGAANALRLEARCTSFSEKYGHELRLEVHEVPGVGLPEELYNAVSEFAGRFAPPSAQLRGQPGADGWVRKPSGVDARAWAVANRPSTFASRSVAWLYASAPSQNAAGPRVGKWQLFVSAGMHDDVWQSVLVALCEGRLGCAAKTAPPEADQRSAVVIVYTRDWEDRSDVLRVALELLSKIVPKTKTLCYKTDAHTIAGVYADDGPTSLYKIKPGETQLTVDEKVLAQARELVAQDAGGGGGGGGGSAPQQAPQVQAFTGTGRTLGGGAAAAAAPEVVSLLSDSDDDVPAAQPQRKAAKTGAHKTAAEASRTAAAQKTATAVKPWLRPDSDAADSAAADAGTLGIQLLGTWAGVPPSAVARWLVEGASASERVMTARACSGELRMRDAAARMPTGDAYAGARCTKVGQTETAPPSPAPKPKQERMLPPQQTAAPSTNALLAGLHAERAARQRGAQ